MKSTYTKKDGQKMVRITLAITPENKKILDQLARKNNQNIGGYISTLLLKQKINHDFLKL